MKKNFKKKRLYKSNAGQYLKKKKTNMKFQGSIGSGFYSKSKIRSNSSSLSKGEIFDLFVLILVYRHHFLYILSPSTYPISTLHKTAEIHKRLQINSLMGLWWERGWYFLVWNHGLTYDYFTSTSTAMPSQKKSFRVDLQSFLKVVWQIEGADPSLAFGDHARLL